MNNVYISIFGLNLSTINDFKNVINNQISSDYKINWTNITDDRLDILLINEDFSEINHVKNINKKTTSILKVSKNEKSAGEIQNNHLYLPLISSIAVNLWLDEALEKKQQLQQSNTRMSFPTEEEKAKHKKIDYKHISSTFSHIYSEYPDISNFTILNEGIAIAVFDLNNNLFYLDSEFNLENISDFIIIPAEINTIIKFKKHFKPKDLHHAFWQFVWDISPYEVPQHNNTYRLLKWPQPNLKFNRHALLKISAYLSKGCSIQYIHEKTNISVNTINRYLFACDIAQMMEEIPSHEALVNLPMVVETNEIGAVRGFFNNLRKKLGL